jgi:uncharacterized protein YjdB
VDETGRVTGLKAGTATITFTAADGTKKSTTVKVRVGKWTDSITLGEHAESLVSGKSMTVKATSLTVDGQTPTVKALKWISSDPNVATVSNGKVTAKTVYRNTCVTIKATTTDGSDVEAGFTLIIKPKTKEVLLLNEAGWPVNGQTLTYLYESVHYLSFSSSLYDSDTDTETDPDVTWKSSNPKVATVSKFEYQGTMYVAVAPKSPGKTDVTFRVKHNGKTIKAKVAVTILKYVNPFKALKIGSKSIVSLFKKTNMAHATKALKGKITYKLKKGWKLHTISCYNAKDGSNYKNLDPKKSNTIKKGYRLSFGLSYNGAEEQEYWIEVE